MDSIRAAVFVCCGVVLAASAPADGGAASGPKREARSGELRDAWGRTIRRADGERISYPHDPALKPIERQATGRGSGQVAPAGVTQPPAPLAAWPLDVREEWRRNVYGQGIGTAGLQAADIDADGSTEIVANAWSWTDFWYVLRADGVGGYRQIWASDDYRDTIGSLRIAQLDADPALEIVVGVGGDILIYDGATHELQSSFATPASAVRGLTITDVDRDGMVEAVFCDDSWETNRLYVYDIASGSQEYAGAAQGGYDLAVGNVDADPDLEIVIGKGHEPGLVLNGTTRAVEWTNPGGFGEFVRLGDLDWDGRDEVVAGHPWHGISIFDVDLQSLSGSIPVDYELDAVRLFDCDGDGALEIVYEDRGIRARDARTLALEWEIASLEDVTSDIAFCDCDGDGSREVLWGTGANDSGPDYLFAASISRHAIEWHTTDSSGPFYALADGDVDADGRPELLYGSYLSDGGVGDGLWFVHDAASKALEFQSGPASGWDSRLWRVRHANVDTDPQQEIFVPSGNVSAPMLFCYDGLTHAEQWRAPLNGRGPVTALDLGDVTGDGAPELVVASGLGVQLLNPATGATRWQSPNLTDFYILPLLRLADVDGDSLLEIVTADNEGFVFVIDRPADTIRELGDQGVSALDVVELDHDGHAEIVVGTTTGDLRILSPTGAIERTVAHYPAGVDGLDVADLTGDGVADYVAAVANEVSIRDGADGTTLWSSGRLRNYRYNDRFVGVNDSLYVADIDGDSRSEIVVNLGSIGLRVYEVPNSHDLSLTAIDAPDPSLVGDDVAYTFTIANRGTIVATGVSLVVTVPAAASFVSASLPGCSHVAPLVTCALGTLAGEASKAVTVVLTAGAAGALTVSGSVTATGIDADPSDNTASATTTITATVIADLGLAKDDGQVFAAPGQPLTYQLTVTNAGPWPVSSVTLTDALPAALENPVFTPLTGAYDPVSGAWNGLNLAAGQSAALELTATVDPAASGFLTNTALVAPPAGTDDSQLGNNTAAHTDTVGVHLGELAHGSSLRAAPNASGEVYFWMQQAPRSSYEVVLDEIAGDLGSSAQPIHLQRLGADAVSVLGEAIAAGLGSGRSLRWQNTGGSVIADQLLRVRSAGCTDDCGPQARFRLRAYETTCRSPRFNNAGGQTSVVILQNGGVSAASGTIWFWGPNGVLLASREFSDLAPHAQLALSTSTVPGLAGQAGSITITHDTSYGSLAGKVVALEPAKGFSFDTPILMRPR